MNIRIVDGRLTKDAEVKINPNNGRKFLTFTMANNGFQKGSQTTTFFNVVSYNEHDVENSGNFTKGKLVVVQGKPNEVMAIKDNKTYLNRNIIAYNIEPGTPNLSKENNNTKASLYSDVAPVAPSAPTCEIPEVKANSVQQPSIDNVNVHRNSGTTKNVNAVHENISPTNRTQNYEYQASMPNSDDELPF